MASQTGSPGLTTPSPYQPLPGIPPNMSVAAAVSAGLLPANALITGVGLDARGGRTVAEAMSKGGEVGSFVNAYSVQTFNSDANGGSGPGAGQLNQTEGPSSGQTNQLATVTPASSVTVTAGPQFGG